MDIENKCIVVTGSSSGIGREIINILSTYKNTNIVAVGLNFDENDILPTNVVKFEGDLSKQETIDELFKFAIDTLGRIDIFFANAGFAYYEKIDKPDFKHIENIYKLNVFSQIYSIEKMAQINKDRDYKVVVTASSMGLVPIPGYAMYGSTKSAINTFVKGYRYELDDPRKISVLYPIGTKTNFFKESGNDVPKPFPTQTAYHVAKCAIMGVIKDKKSIYPSKIFVTLITVNRVFPFLTEIYALVQKSKFKRWYNR